MDTTAQSRGYRNRIMCILLSVASSLSSSTISTMCPQAPFARSKSVATLNVTVTSMPTASSTSSSSPPCSCRQSLQREHMCFLCKPPWRQSHSQRPLSRCPCHYASLSQGGKGTFAPRLELLYEVMSHCDMDSLMRLAQTSRFNRMTVGHHIYLRKRLLATHFFNGPDSFYEMLSDCRAGFSGSAALLLLLLAADCTWMPNMDLYSPAF